MELSIKPNLKNKHAKLQKELRRESRLLCRFGANFPINSHFFEVFLCTIQLLFVNLQPLM